MGILLYLRGQQSGNDLFLFVGVSPKTGVAYPDPFITAKSRACIADERWVHLIDQLQQFVALGFHNVRITSRLDMVVPE